MSLKWIYYTFKSLKYLTVIVREIDPKMRVRDSSALRIFFKKNMMMLHWAQKPAAKLLKIVP